MIRQLLSNMRFVLAVAGAAGLAYAARISGTLSGAAGMDIALVIGVLLGASVTSVGVIASAALTKEITLDERVRSKAGSTLELLEKHIAFVVCCFFVAVAAAMLPQVVWWLLPQVAGAHVDADTIALFFGFAALILAGLSTVELMRSAVVLLQVRWEMTTRGNNK